LQSLETAPLKCEGKIPIQGNPSPEKWTTADEGIQYLRELAVLEVIYSDLDDDEDSKEPRDVLCTQAMWQKVIQGAPASYSYSLAAMYCPDMDTPTVESVFLATKL